MVNVVEKVQAGEKLPKGWKWVKLGDVCDTSTENRDPRLMPDLPFQYVDIASVDNASKRILDFKTLLGKDAPSRARQVIRTGNVIVSTTRPNLNAVALVPQELENQICSTGFCVLRPSKAIEPSYLFNFVQSSEFVQNLSNLVKGALYPAVTDRQVLAQSIPLPPLPEQKRIVGILSDRLTAIDKARIATEAQLKAAKALPAAYLRQVFDSPEAQKWKRKKFGDIALTVQNGVYKSSEYYGHGYPFIRMYNIQNTSWNLNLDTLAQVSLDDHELEKFRLEVGDLLISRVNSFELVGKCGLVSSMAKGYVFENMLIRVQLIDSIDSLFVAQQMGHCTIRKQVQGVAKQAIGQASINSTDIRNIELMLPSFSEQRTISAKINKALEQVEKLQQSLQSQLTTINQLPAVILRQAFNGEL